MSGYRTGGSDFDDLFDPDVTGDGPGADGYRRNGQALRYAHIRYGLKRADVGYRQGGLDLSNLWAAKGTATYTLPINGQTFSAGNQAKTNSTGPCTATVTFILDSNGTYRVQLNQNGGGNNNSWVEGSGAWLPAGAAAAEYDVQFEVGNAGQASIGNGAPNYANCSTTRSVGASVSVPSASAESRGEMVTFVIRLRRSNGAVSTTQIYASVGASGWY